MQAPVLVLALPFMIAAQAVAGEESARQHQRGQRLEAAEQVARAHLTKNPNDPNAQQLLADVLLQADLSRKNKDPADRRLARQKEILSLYERALNSGRARPSVSTRIAWIKQRTQISAPATDIARAHTANGGYASVLDGALVLYNDALKSGRVVLGSWVQSTGHEDEALLSHLPQKLPPQPPPRENALMAQMRESGKQGKAASKGNKVPIKQLDPSATVGTAKPISTGPKGPFCVTKPDSSTVLKPMDLIEVWAFDGTNVLAYWANRENFGTTTYEPISVPRDQVWCMPRRPAGYMVRAYGAATKLGLTEQFENIAIGRWATGIHLGLAEWALSSCPTKTIIDADYIVQHFECPGLSISAHDGLVAAVE